MEIWQPHPKFALYEISTAGAVRSNTPWSKGAVLSGSPDRKGYRRVYVAGKLRYVHQLVLETYVGPCPPGQECLHANDVPDDNRLENLRWGSRSDNRHDSVRNGGHPWASRSECKNGHPFTGSNLIVIPRQRVCRECARQRRAAYNAKLRSQGVVPGTPGARLKPTIDPNL